jgi:hypothetical protein
MLELFGPAGGRYAFIVRCNIFVATHQKLEYKHFIQSTARHATLTPGGDHVSAGRLSRVTALTQKSPSQVKDDCHG